MIAKIASFFVKTVIAKKNFGLTHYKKTKKPTVGANVRAYRR